MCQNVSEANNREEQVAPNRTDGWRFWLVTYPIALMFSIFVIFGFFYAMGVLVLGLSSNSVLSMAATNLALLALAVIMPIHMLHQEAL